jgi:hypothetical protein
MKLMSRIKNNKVVSVSLFSLGVSVITLGAVLFSPSYDQGRVDGCDAVMTAIRNPMVYTQCGLHEGKLTVTVMDVLGNSQTFDVVTGEVVQ